MTTSPILGMTELAEGQAVPHTTVNEMARYLEQGSHFFRVLDRDLTAPPGSPADGDSYLLPASPTGDWSGQGGKIAFRMSTAWEFIAPLPGFAAYVHDEAVTIVFNGLSWSEIGGGAYTDENARDAIATALVAGANVTITPDDGANTITIAAASGATYTDEQVRDVVGATLVAGTGVTITPNDGADTITIAASGGEGGGGGVNDAYALPACPALSTFTTGNTSATRTVTESSGRAILIRNSNTDGVLLMHGIYRAKPSSPYRVAIAVSATSPVFNYVGFSFGWRESSTGKLVVTTMLPSVNTWENQNWNSLTSRSSAATASFGNPSNGIVLGLQWVALREDATNVYVEHSLTGHKDDWRTIRTLTKSGAFISSFDQLFVGLFNADFAGADCRMAVRCWDENGLTREWS